MTKQPTTLAKVQHQAANNLQQIAASTKKRQGRLYGVGILAIAITIAVFFFKRYQQQKDTKAQSEMFQAVYYFEQGEFEKALQGDGVYAGLLDIAKEYRFTKTANLAHFYIGTSYMYQKAYEAAIQHLQQFQAADFLLQARAWVLLGDAFTAQQAYGKAAQYYMKAVNYKPNKVFTPIYLSKAALAYEANRELQAALGCYQRIIEEFLESEQYAEACKHAARLSNMHNES